MNNDSCHDAALLRLSKPGRHWETGNWRLFITGLSNIGPLRKPNGSWGDLMQKCIEWEHVQYSNLFIIYIYISICNINGFIYRHRFQHLSSITSTNDGIYTYIYIYVYFLLHGFLIHPMLPKAPAWYLEAWGWSQTGRKELPNRIFFAKAVPQVR